MKLGIHSAPERDEALDRVARRFRGHQRRHRLRAHIVVDRADELVAVGEALVEVALGQTCRAADRTHGQRGPGLAAQRLDAGGDEFVAAQDLAVLQRNARPSAPSLTGRHITP
jgi:hypothetical protein